MARRQQSKNEPVQVEITYVGPSEKFVDASTGSTFAKGEPTEVDVDLAKRLLTDYGHKFESDQAKVELVFSLMSEETAAEEPKADPLEALLIEQPAAEGQD